MPQAHARAGQPSRGWAAVCARGTAGRIYPAPARAQGTSGFTTRCGPKAKLLGSLRWPQKNINRMWGPAKKEARWCNCVYVHEAGPAWGICSSAAGSHETGGESSEDWTGGSPAGLGPRERLSKTSASSETKATDDGWVLSGSPSSVFYRESIQSGVSKKKKRKKKRWNLAGLCLGSGDHPVTVNTQGSVCSPQSLSDWLYCQILSPVSNQLRDLVLPGMQIPGANNRVRQLLDPSGKGNSFAPCQMGRRRVHPASPHWRVWREEDVLWSRTNSGSTT